MDEANKLIGGLLIACVILGVAALGYSARAENYSEEIETLNSYVEELEADVEYYREESERAYAEIMDLENNLSDAYVEIYDIEADYCYLDAPNKTYHRIINFTECTFPQLIELAFPTTYKQFSMSKQCASMLFGASPCLICYD